MSIAHKSSIMAIVNIKSFKFDGILFPSKANTPTANAMSVAVGIAQPFIANSLPLFIETI